MADTSADIKRKTEITRECMFYRTISRRSWQSTLWIGIIIGGQMTHSRREDPGVPGLRRVGGRKERVVSACSLLTTSTSMEAASINALAG